MYIFVTLTNKIVPIGSCKKLVGTTWLAGNRSYTLVMTKELAKEYGLDHPSNVIIEGRSDGILIRRFEL